MASFNSLPSPHLSCPILSVTASSFNLLSSSHHHFHISSAAIVVVALLSSFHYHVVAYLPPRSHAISDHRLLPIRRPPSVNCPSSSMCSMHTSCLAHQHFIFKHNADIYPFDLHTRSSPTDPTPSRSKLYNNICDVIYQPLSSIRTRTLFGCIREQ